ncbi:MAG TPA: AAA family ATPase [Geobacterales bacterium]|nr:AAA family ATPase [Geobacterales bacterium]
MDFLAFFGLSEEPFRLTPDPTYFLASRSHHNALLSLTYSAQNREGFTLVAGEPGTGKTTLLNVFIDQWRERAEIAMILTPRLSPAEFLLAVLEDLGIPCDSSNKNEIIRRFRDFLVERSLSQRPVIIVVDEAQNLPDETLEELRLLSNMETEKEKLLHIILLGQPELLERLEARQLRQFNQRIVSRIFLYPLIGNEVRDYLTFRLAKAGRGTIDFSEPAIDVIREFSDGTPRLINIVATRAMMAAYLEQAHEVRPRHVRFAVRSLRLEDGRSLIHRGRRGLWFGCASAAALLVAVTISFWFAPKAGAVIPVNKQTEAPLPPPSPVAVQTPPSAVAQEIGSRQGKISSREAEVWERPSRSSRRRQHLYQGEEVIVTGETTISEGERWQRIELPSGPTGWLAAKDLAEGVK